MEHEALTVSKDQKQLLDGAVEAGLFKSRSGAIRTVLAAYSESDLERTAALVATDERIQFRDVTDILDVDVETFANLVREPNVDAVPAELNAHLEDGRVENVPSATLESILSEFEFYDEPDRGETE
jgi:Arc/MetJ-type ribon-helix-helix transcriptional regulator